MSDDRIERMKNRLHQALHPMALEIIDESHKHAGHAGAQGGKGHYKMKIVSKQFEGELPVARHRLIYAALGDMMDNEIHALNIKALTPDETQPV